MSAASANTVSFEINIVGETTGEKWIGTFECKIRLSKSDQLKQDLIRRDLLGKDPQNAGPLATDLAEILSQLRVRITKAPAWWEGSMFGMNMEDDQVLEELYKRTIKAEADAMQELRKKAGEAKQELRDLVKDSA